MPTVDVNGTTLHDKDDGPTDAPALVFSPSMLFDGRVPSHRRPRSPAATGSSAATCAGRGSTRKVLTAKFSQSVWVRVDEDALDAVNDASNPSTVGGTPSTWKGPLASYANVRSSFASLPSPEPVVESVTSRTGLLRTCRA